MSYLLSRISLITNLVFLRASGVNCIAYTNTALMALTATDFEVFGKVQGVFFRKFTKDQADKLGVKGWCMNTNHGSVVGYIEGPEEKILEMSHWLSSTGSPTCNIDRIEFRNKRYITSFECPTFQIKK